MSTITRDQPGAGVVEAGYRPHLDGIRALAVYLVVVFHAGVTSVDGGFIGVDVFFVISGYLVTQILLRDLEGPGGDPASVGSTPAGSGGCCRPRPSTLLVTAAVYSAVASPADVAAAADAIRACVPLRRQLVLHRPGHGLLRRGLRPEPGAALLVAGGGGAVLPAAGPCSSVACGGSLGRGGARDRLVRPVVMAGGRRHVGVGVVLRCEPSSRAGRTSEPTPRAYQLLAGALLAVLPSVIARRRVDGSPRRRPGRAWPGSSCWRRPWSMSIRSSAASR